MWTLSIYKIDANRSIYTSGVIKIYEYVCIKAQAPYSWQPLVTITDTSVEYD